MRVGTVGIAIAVGRHKLLKLSKVQKWDVIKDFLLGVFNAFVLCNFCEIIKNRSHQSGLS
jgi:hypothetical protein